MSDVDIVPRLRLLNAVLATFIACVNLCLIFNRELPLLWPVSLFFDAPHADMSNLLYTINDLLSGFLGWDTTNQRAMTVGIC